MPTAPDPQRADSSRSSQAGDSHGDRDAGHGLCVFDLPSGRFGLDVRLVGEVVPVDRWIEVARAPRGVIGLFNLRGLPVALVDLPIVLDMPGPAAAPPAVPLALVLRADAGVLAAIQVVAVVAVIPAGAATITGADRDVDHPAIAGFAATPDAGVVSVLDRVHLHQRLATLRHR